MELRDTQRLEHILDYCEDIERSVDDFGDSYDCFISNRAYQYAVAFCILQIGELTGAITPEIRAQSSEINWPAIKGMRNIVVHDYGKIDLDLVWKTVKNDIPILKSFCNQMLRTN